MSGRLTAGVIVSLVVCALMACTGRDDGEHDENNFRGDVIECEDALSRLEACCPDFDPTPVLCNFLYDRSEGCTTTTTSSIEPALSPAESSCIRETSCEALVKDKVCERAQAAREYRKSQTTSSSSSTSGSYGTTYGSTPAKTVTHKAVCP